MSILDKIRSEPREKRIALLWIITGAALILLIILWAVIGNYNQQSRKDTSLFQTVTNGFNQLKQQNFKAGSNQ